MSRFYRAVNLTDEKDSVALLSEDKIIDDFNHLLENDFVDLKDGKIRLTSKGEEAKKQVSTPVTDEQKTEKALEEFSEKKGKLGMALFLISVFLFLLSVLLFLVIHWGGESLLEKMIWML